MQDADVIRWRKSSHSGSSGGSCGEVASIVEVADSAAVVAVVAVRDSKNPDGPKLTFGPSAWRTFAAQVKNGALDLA